MSESGTPASAMLTVKEACEYLRLSRQMLWKLRVQHKLKATMIGRAVRFRRSELDRLIEKGTRNMR